jgi:predicted AlkP superfamily pyrophosphatase or phosphodiesterase
MPRAALVSAIAVGAVSLSTVWGAQPPARTPGVDRASILAMFARAYYPGRSGQVMLAPREGVVITTTDPNYPFMHGSPWDYDTRIPLIFHGAPFFREGRYGDAVSQQVIAPTVAALLKLPMPVTTTGRAVTRALDPAAPAPRAVFIAVLDAFRADYLDRHAAALPTLDRLRREGANFTEARVNYLPTATAVAHATISTGTDPAIHGINVNLRFNAITGKAEDPFPPDTTPPVMVPTLADLWNLETAGRAVIAAQGSLYYAPAGLAGHGACMSNGRKVIMSAYSTSTGGWVTNPDCFRLPEYLAAANARTVWEGAGGRWWAHDITGPTEVRRSAIFARFEAEALLAVIRNEPFGADDVTDLLLANFKTPDFVGHKFGPDSPELAETLAVLDAQLARILEALDARIGKDRYVVVITADHGMPPEPPRGGRVFAEDVTAALNARFDPLEKRVVQLFEESNGQIYLDRSRLRALGFGLADVAGFLEEQPYIAAAFTEDDVRAAASRGPSTR